MTGESQTFHVGQEVEVTYRARVAEVLAGGAVGGPILRLEPLNGSYHSPPGGWVDPEVVGIDVISQPNNLPTRRGMYWCEAEDTDAQDRADLFHTDDKEFYYLNGDGKWADVGWGTPSLDAKLEGPLVEAPF